MRMKSQYLFVIGVAVVVVLYFVVRSLFGAVSPHPAQAKTAPAAAGPPSVQVQMIPEAERRYDVVVRGRTQATRTMVCRYFTRLYPLHSKIV